MYFFEISILALTPATPSSYMLGHRSAEGNSRRLIARLEAGVSDVVECDWKKGPSPSNTGLHLQQPSSILAQYLGAGPLSLCGHEPQERMVAGRPNQLVLPLVPAGGAVQGPLNPEGRACVAHAESVRSEGWSETDLTASLR